MNAVVGLLVMLLGVSHGVETSCDGRKDGAQCFGALGGAVFLQLMDSASEKLGCQWSNKTTTIFRWRNNDFIANVIENRSVFTPQNGTFRINNLTRTDGGEYLLTITDSNGKALEKRTLQLTIQAPVSSVLLLSECLSQGQRGVSCSSQTGDSPQYSWTLDRQKLTDAELLSGNTETISITLKQHVSGRLLCSVSNNVSSVSVEEKISDCGFIFINCTESNVTISQWVFAANNTLCIDPKTTAPTTTTQTSTEAGNLPIMAGVLSALVILLVVGVAVVYTQRNKKNKTPKEEEDQELTYAEVRIVQRSRRQRQREQMPEVEVEYGQVKFSERPQQTAEPAGDECVYAKVRKGR